MPYTLECYVTTVCYVSESKPVDDDKEEQNANEEKEVSDAPSGRKTRIDESDDKQPEEADVVEAIVARARSPPR
jgi:hypothetical protein